MSARKTKVIKVNISAGTYTSYEEAVKEANAIKRWLIRLCEKKGYSCKAVMGISMNNPHAGTVKTKGRKKEFVVSGGAMMPSLVDAHIHMVIYGNPADMIIKELRNHLNKKHKKSVIWSKECKTIEEVENGVNYAMKQSLKIRTVDYDRQDMLSADEWGYCEALNGATDSVNGKTAFTKSISEQQAITLESTSISEVQNTSEELQYKSYKEDIASNTFIFYHTFYNIYNVLKLYIHSLYHRKEPTDTIHILSIYLRSIKNLSP